MFYKKFNDFLAESQKLIGDIKYDIMNQKYCSLAGMHWELNKLLIQHDTDQLTFDEMIKLFISLISKIQLANQNRFKNYNITPFPNNIYVSPPISNSMNTIPSQHQITKIYFSFAHIIPIKTILWNFQQLIKISKNH